MGRWIIFLGACLALAAGVYYITLPQDAPQKARRSSEKLVVVEPVRALTVRDRIEALGTLRAREEVTIVAESQGIIKTINFAEGSQVEKNALLIQLDNKEEKALLASARAVLTESQRQFDRLKDLSKRNTVSQARVDEQRAAVSTASANVRVAEVRLAKRAITAPFSGRIGLREVSPGDLLQVGSAVTTLDDVSILQILFDVPEKYLSILRDGLSVAGRSAAYPGRVFEGKINRVDTRVDSITRTIDVQAVIPNDENLLKPGLSMTVELLGEKRPALIVNETAILAVEDSQYVFVVDGGQAKRKLVQLGTRYDKSIEVASGITAQDRVITQGLQGLSDGAVITIKETDAAARPPSGNEG